MTTAAVKHHQKHPRLIKAILFALLSFVSIAEAIDGPAIDVWYGPEQTFGSFGRPQPWCNIVGNASSGQGVRSLAYVLNGGSRVELSMGPDGRCLSRAGDFNIDLACQDLDDGRNQVVIEAEDQEDRTSTATVEVDYTSDTVWPLPYVINWGAVDRIHDVAEIVDGKWRLEGRPGADARARLRSHHCDWRPVMGRL